MARKNRIDTVKPSELCLYTPKKPAPNVARVLEVVFTNHGVEASIFCCLWAHAVNIITLNHPHNMVV
ncbi:hypothetical protein [Sphingobacterium shayense]|uniref:hypothetical protein n=1 Tax=Sphingobacterium shayense TaxID=626343 RepID=UPI001C12E800|nr:hypothetical protein [Sphingobacterium shayense]